MRLTDSEIENVVKEENEVSFREIFKKSGKKWLKVKCRCGDDFEVMWDHYKRLNKKKCNACNGKKRLTLEEVKKEVSNSGGVLLSGLYKNTSENLSFMCRCGEVFNTSLKRFRLGKKNCDKCVGKRLSKKFTKTSAEFTEMLNAIHGNGIQVVSGFKGMSNKIIVSHVTCGISWEANPGDLVYNKSGCPSCASSKGEVAIRAWLTERSLKFSEQLRLEDCRNKRPLPFDFAVYDSGNLIALIEYDGRQHFDNRCFDGHSFQSTVKNDAIKNDYCEKNGIPLIRIPYFNFESINDILNDNICKLIPSQAG